MLLNPSRYPWRRQHHSPNRFQSRFLLVEEADAGVGPPLHTHSRGHDRGHGDSIRSQGWEGTRQVRLHSGQVVTELVLWADCGGCEVF